MFGFSMISAPLTTGSTEDGRTFMSDRVCLLRATLAPGMRSSGGQYSETVTTKSGPVELLTTTRLSGRMSLSVATMSGGALMRSISFLSLDRSFCTLNSSASEWRLSVSADCSSAMSLTFLSSSTLIFSLRSSTSYPSVLLSLPSVAIIVKSESAPVI